MFRRDDSIRVVSVALFLIPLLFLAAGLWRASPFVDDVTPELSAGDDWLTYRQYAESVLRGGWTIPALDKAYAAVPHGFLYVYFIAGVFAIAGENASYVYVVQSLLLGLSVTVCYLAFSRRLQAPLLRNVLLAGLVAIAVVEFFRTITFRLLSENLFIALAALFWYLFAPGGVWSTTRMLSAGAVLGLSVLTRPSTVLAAAAVVIVATAAAWRGRPGWAAPAALCAGLAAGLSPSVLRDFASTGHLGFQLVTETRDWIRIWNAPLPDFLDALGRRTAFAFGWTSLMDAAYRIRVHWMILWMGAGLYASRRLIARAPMHWWDVAVVLYVVCYFGPVILVADISSYGGRMVVVALPMLLYLAVRGLDDVLSGTSVDPERIVPVPAARLPQAQSPKP